MNSHWAKGFLGRLVTGVCFSACLTGAAEPSASGGAPVDLTELSLQELMAVKIERVSTPSRFTQGHRERGYNRAPAAAHRQHRQ